MYIYICTHLYIYILIYISIYLCVRTSQPRIKYSKYKTIFPCTSRTTHPHRDTQETDGTHTHTYTHTLIYISVYLCVNKST